MTANEQAAGDAANRLTKKIADARRLDADATPGPWTVGIPTGSQPDFDIVMHARNHHAALWDCAEALERLLDHADFYPGSEGGKACVAGRAALARLEQVKP